MGISSIELVVVGELLISTIEYEDISVLKKNTNTFKIKI